jgi:hypothetical protein
MMKIPNHLYVLGDTYTCHTYCCYAYHFTRTGCTLFTCDMYMCRLRLINDSVLSSLKMEGIRLLYYLSSPTPSATRAHTYDYVTRFKVNIARSSGPSSDVTIPPPLPQHAPTHTITKRVSRSTLQEAADRVLTSRSDGTTPKVLRNITPPKTYKCQNYCLIVIRQAVVNTVMNLRVPQDLGETLD